MKNANRILSISALLVALGGCSADTSETTTDAQANAIELTRDTALDTAAITASALSPPSMPPVDSPRLAHLGDYAVGTVTETVTIDNSIRLTPTASRFVEETRSLSVRVWYPASTADDAAHIQYTRALPLFDGSVVDIVLPGIAVDAAAPINGETFPLIVASHGFGGWATSMTNLTENLASKGYVVVAIDHEDVPSDPMAGPFAFPNVVIHRSHDQRAVIKAMTQSNERAPVDFRALINREQIGLIGYSMGGFGAIATLGASYDADGASLQRLNLPTPAMDQLLANDNAGVDSAVLLAPWGAQSDVRAWPADALASVDQPVLLVGGDLDDVSMYDDGIRWLYQNMTGSPRSLLTYQMARHNVANNPLHRYVPNLQKRFPSIEYFAEPVWRSDRINAINQHFITAFFDSTLKGHTAHGDYLDVPTTLAVDGEWPLGFGQAAGDQVAGDAQPEYWPGFHRRWAVGLKLEQAAPK
ncbi:MAG: dienelactone hydrolase [Pseudomonadota bacterium]